MSSKSRSTQLIRNFTFGVEDSLASTVGLLSGIASAEVNSRIIIISGLILILTEALSMGVGSFLSEESADDYSHHKFSQNSSVIAGVVMFVSYFISGLVPIFPYTFLPVSVALIVSILFSLGGLAILGYLTARFSKRPVSRYIVRTLLLGGSVAISGMLVGTLLKNISI